MLQGQCDGCGRHSWLNEKYLCPKCINKQKQKQKKEKVNWKEIMGMNRDTYERKNGAWRRK